MNFYTRLILALLSLGMALLAGIGIYRGLHPEAVVQSLALKTPVEKGEPLLGGPFSLRDQNGKGCTHKDFLGKWMLVYFGYTFCPDICPMGLSAMSEAVERIDPESRFIQPIFITIDPERDTPENLKIYKENFHLNFTMLTGSNEETQQAMRQYRVYGAKIHPKGTSDYLMDHSSLIYLMDPEGKYVAHFSHQTTPEEIVSKLHKICGL